MKIEVLSHLVLRLVVGFFMCMHAIYTLLMHMSYVEKLEFYLNNLRLLDNEFFSMVAPLFPFLELFVSSLLLLGIWIRKSLLLSFILIGVLATIHFLLGHIVMLSIIAFVLGSLVAGQIYFSRSSPSYNSLNDASRKIKI